ncbi:MAG: hypothetical protein ACYS1A_20005, partial [Planctomycetota bacterium]
MYTVHVKNIEKYHPSYKDRDHKWAKIHWESFLDDKITPLNETDRYRFISLIIHEVFRKEPTRLDRQNLTILGWNTKKRPISLTLQMLHTLLEVRDSNSENPVTQNKKEKEKESKKEKVSHLDFVFLTKEEHSKLVEKFGESRTADLIEKLNSGIGSKGYKYKSHYFTILNWARRDDKENPPSRPQVSGETTAQYKERIRKEYEPYLRQKSPQALRDLKKDGGHISQVAGWLIDEILRGKAAGK